MEYGKVRAEGVYHVVEAGTKKVNDASMLEVGHYFLQIGNAQWMLCTTPCTALFLEHILELPLRF